MYKLSLAHIYPNLLNFYGDAGNVLALKKRCEWRGIDIDIVEINEGDDISADCDIYYLGGATSEQQEIALKYLIKQKNNLKTVVKKSAVVVAISESLQILGEYFQYQTSEKQEGLGVLDIYSIEGESRFVGNVTAECDFLSPKEIVGFENHSMQTFLKDGGIALSNVLIGKGNNGVDKTEGVRQNNVFGTYLHGAFLPKNPHFTDYLIKCALKRKYGKDIVLKDFDDEIELNTYKKLVGKKY